MTLETPTGRLPQRRARDADPGRFALPAPSSEAALHSASLQQAIGRAIESAGGWLPFDRYMQLALYAPGLGYYVAGATTFGASDVGGDFVTAPEISVAFAGVLAAQIAPVLRATTPRVLEFGAGTGALAAQLCAALGALGVPPVEYLVVEVSPSLRARQRQRLAHLPVRWLDAPPAGFVGAIIANEVLDVMPVRLFVRRGTGVLERGVVRAPTDAPADPARAFVFDERPADAALAAAVAGIEAALDAPLPDGYGAEWAPIAQAWTASLADTLAHGVALLIDYGFPRHEYYHPQRLMGTLMCHFRHRSHADPLWWPGLNDITAHVDFSAIADAAADAGLDVLGYTSQGRFLLDGGVLSLMEEAGVRERAAALRLVSEAEMGELFKVLAVGRGLIPRLPAFARGDRLHTL